MRWTIVLSIFSNAFQWQIRPSKHPNAPQMRRHVYMWLTFHAYFHVTGEGSLNLFPPNVLFLHVQVTFMTSRWKNSIGRHVFLTCGGPRLILSFMHLCRGRLSRIISPCFPEKRESELGTGPRLPTWLANVKNFWCLNPGTEPSCCTYGWVCKRNWTFWIIGTKKFGINRALHPPSILSRPRGRGRMEGGWRARLIPNFSVNPKFEGSLIQPFDVWTVS